jgi:hypothetical protein
MRPLTRGGGRPESQVLTTLTAIIPGQTGDLRTMLEAFSPGDGSPLARLRDVHFGRWVVIEQLKTDWPGAPRRRPQLRSAYLLFSVTVTFTPRRGYRFPRSFVEEMWASIPAEADRVWGHCIGYPGTGSREAFVEYLLAARLRTAVHRYGYPAATVEEVGDALTAREAFTAFALANQGKSAAQLQQAYREAAEQWLS